MEYKDFAIDLALRAGELMRQNFTLGMKKEWKADNTPVTATDLSINKMVIDAVRKEYPAHDVLAEEESSLENSSEFLWVCDPLDSTLGFSHGIPIFTFSLALVKNGKSILGVIYDPTLDRLVWAEEGKGAYLNGKQTFVSNTDEIRNQVVDIESSRPKEFFIYEAVRSKGGKILKLNASVFGGMMVAAGEFVAEIDPHENDSPHDKAAIKIIVEEAGGKVTDFDGNEQKYDGLINGTIISNGKVHDLLIESIKKAKGE